MVVIYSSDLFTCNAKYFQTLSGEKWRSFAYSLRSTLKLRSTAHEVAWQDNNLAYSSGLMFGRVICTIAFRLLSEVKVSRNGPERRSGKRIILPVRRSGYNF